LRGNLVDGQAIYDADRTHALAIERTRRPKPAELVSDPWLRESVHDRSGRRVQG
jgi:hypothetical protein